MTVKEAVSVLTDAKVIDLVYGASSVKYDKNDPFMLDACGNFVVAELFGFGEGVYELAIALRPVRAGEC